MRRFFSVVTFGVLLFVAPSLFAQATRTWVSGVGDDVNPCSRTAPCKTFAGAISKTAAGGEISVLDPGGYGAVTITKSITINAEGTLAGVLFAGTNGIVINGAGIVVNLMNLSMAGGTTSSPGLSGVRIIQAADVSLDHCDIYNFSVNGISDERTTAGSLTVRNTRIHDSIGSGPTTIGIKVVPSTGTAALTLLVENTQVFNLPQSNSTGVFIANGAKAMIHNSSFSGTLRGVFVNAALGAAEATLTDVALFDNSAGLRVTAGATARLASSTITGNTANGLDLAGGVVQSFGNNYINGNVGNNGAGMTPVALQ